MSIPVEIERKFIIAMPSIQELSAMPFYFKSEILQIYLAAPCGETHRIRLRRSAGNTVYTETVKRRIDSLSAYEDEREISAERFAALAAEIAEGSRPIRKERHCFPYGARVIEIDVYPEWQKSAILEVELASRSECVSLPPFIRVVREVTGEKAYSNASLSHSFPPDALAAE